MTCDLLPLSQIVTHLCYSDFEDILPAIDGLEGAARPSADLRRPVPQGCLDVVHTHASHSSLRPHLHWCRLWTLHEVSIPPCALLFSDQAKWSGCSGRADHRELAIGR